MVLMADSGNSCRSSSSQDKFWRHCFNFAKGMCRFGDGCRFVHDANVKNNSNSGVETKSSNTYDLLIKLLGRLGLLDKIVAPFATNSSTTNSPQTSPINPSVCYANPGPIYYPTAHLISPVPQIGPPPGFGYPIVPMLGPVVQQAPCATPAQLPQMVTTFPHAFTAKKLHDPASVACNMDTGVSFHLNDYVTNLSEVFNSCMYQSISVGDGHSIPVTNTGHSILPTSVRPLHLNNVLITPHIVKNLIYVRQFVRDNNCMIEFDAFGFSVKDFMSRRVLLRCDSTRDLYPVTHPSPIPSAFLVSRHTWHQRLGHPGGDVLRRFISNNVISCNNEKPLILCHAWQTHEDSVRQFQYCRYFLF
ncbi:ribonuclease H-like domain-containing protein [Tanacetum coccineum]